MPGSVIVAGARTPIGKMAGAFAGFSAMDLGGFAIKAALERAGVAPKDVDYVFMGHENCSALVVVRRSDQCVSLVSPKDQEPEFSTSFITSIDRFDRTLLIGTSGGELYETTIPPP